MKRNNIFKILSVLLAFLLTLNSFLFNYRANAQEELTDDEKKVVLEQRLKQLDKRLNYLQSNGEVAQDYVNTLNEKLDYLKQQYDIIEKQYDTLKVKSENTQQQIASNNIAIIESRQKLISLDKQEKQLKDEFKTTYEKYCKRLRALYISNSNNTYLTLLLGSDSIENLLVRMQMFKSVTKADSELLNSVNAQMDSIIDARKNIEKEKNSLEENEHKLEDNKQKLKSERAFLLNSEEELNVKRLSIESEQIKANQTLKIFNDKTQKYGEYRNITKQELEQIDSDIAFGDEKYQQIQEPTTNPVNPNEQTQNEYDNYLSLTFPCPSYTQITCGFGEYKGHSGCDFSTRSHENEKIVAAESGTVILVKLLEKSYGHYIVIRHDKLTKSGEVVYTLYAHNNDIIVNEGDYVNKGQQIAYSGTTGNSTGPHCHFEVRVGGSSQAYAKNPADYLPIGSG